MKQMRRILSAALVVLMLSATACAANEPVSTETTAAGTAATTAPDTTTAAPAETGVPLELVARNFEGDTFNILAQRWSTYAPLDYVDIAVTENNGEV